MQPRRAIPKKFSTWYSQADDQPTNVMKPSKESFYSRFLGVPERFRCGKQIGSYLGLIPCEESRTKASAVMGPTPRCVISRCTSGRRSASCSIAATELCQGLRGHAYCSTSWPTEFEIGLSLPQDYGVIASVCKSLSSVSIASGKNGAQSELSHHVTIRTAPRQRRKIGDARCAIYHIVSSHFHKIEMFCIYVGLRIGIYCVT